jgi:lysophospholipase L1-like esterase
MIRRPIWAPRTTIAIALATVVMVIGAPAPLRAAEPPKFSPPKAYYLALGDSFAYGFQYSKWLAGLPPSGFDTGYVDVFADRLRRIQPAIEVVNYACVGESTGTFTRGTCLGKTLGVPLHDEFSGTQLQAAVAFLSAHRGEVSPITLTLWGNDIRELSEACGGDPTCMLDGAPATITQIATNLRTTLAQLRAAAPEAEIIVTGPWNSGIGAFPVTDPLYLALNDAMADAASPTRTRFADLFPMFNPQGDIDAETATICALTLLCTQGDIHPSDAGYRAMADKVWEASDYARLME